MTVAELTKEDIGEDLSDVVPIEFNGLPFEPKRIFYVCDVPKAL